MTKRFPIGAYHTHLVMDVTKYPAIKSPVQDTSMPLYLGGGMLPQVGDAREVGMGPRVERVEVVSILGSEDALNPFEVPVVCVQRQ